jgi:hypothetical protein
MFFSLFLISAAVLAYEMLLMRIFAITQWYHFAYMIISIALLGFGASGTFIAVFRSFFTKHLVAAYRVGAALFSISLILSHVVSRYNRFNPFEIVWDPRQTLYLMEYYVVLFVPFFLAATCVGLMFLRYGDRIGLVYCYNLVGSAIGVAGSIASLYLIHPVLLLYGITGLGIGSLVATSNSPKLKSILKIVLYAVLLGGSIWAIRSDPLRLRDYLNISPYKGLPQAQKLPEAETLSESVSPLGVVHTVSSPLIRHAPGLSLNYSGEVSTQIGIFVDSGNAGGITRIEGLAGSRQLLPATIWNTWTF